jgi:hypothetical protein
MKEDIGKYARFRRLLFVTQVKGQSIKNDDRYTEKVVMFKKYLKRII